MGRVFTKELMNFRSRSGRQLVKRLKHISIPISSPSSSAQNNFRILGDTAHTHAAHNTPRMCHAQSAKARGNLSMRFRAEIRRCADRWSHALAQLRFMKDN